MADATDLMALQFANGLPENRRIEFQMSFASAKKDRTTALMFSLFLGYLGVDRFYLGHTGLGIGKLLTFGGCGIWHIVDLFLIQKAADEINRMSLLQLQGVYSSMGGQPVMQGQQFQPPGYGPPR